MEAQTALPGSLYVVATPLGNLRDITLRALDILGSVDMIAAEDTRVGLTLLRAHGIAKRLVRLDAHTEDARAASLIESMRAGRSVAYISDAGTPGVSDPGARLVRLARETGFNVIPVPGPSAVACAWSAAGRQEPHWLFYGYLGQKSGPRRKALQDLREFPWPLIFYEAPHRISKTLQDMAAILGGQRMVGIARELTKLHESWHECRLEEAEAWVAADANRRKGEFVLIVDGGARVGSEDDVALARTLRVLLEELAVKQAARLASRLVGGRIDDAYRQALKLRRDHDNN
jgi:16S rRNA (cytidine1402-2'-O)-methyltransferase